MSTDGIEYARAEGVIDCPIDRVWAVVGEFGGVERWIDGVTACTVAGEGVGAVRTVTRNGASVRERLERRDSAAREIAYLILDPHMLPAANVRGHIVLEDMGDARTRIVWRSYATDFQVPEAALGERIAAFYAASIQGLDRLLNAA